MKDRPLTSVLWYEESRVRHPKEKHSRLKVETILRIQVSSLAVNPWALWWMPGRPTKACFAAVAAASATALAAKALLALQMQRGINGEDDSNVISMCS